VRSVRRNSNRAFWIKTAGCLTALASCLSATRPASAEVTIVKTDNNWEGYVAGRANAFVTYAVGDSYPVPIVPMGNIVSGGGVDEKNADLIPETDPATGKPDLTKQGTISKMRVRTGLMPEILTLGARKHFNAETTFRAQLSIWATIEPDVYNANGAKGTAPRPGGRDAGIAADFREGFLEIEGPWGGFMGGRFLSLFSRGSFENDFLYGHGYGVGFPGVRAGNSVVGQLSLPGPTSGMAGFGVLGPSYAAGVTYHTPSLSGLMITGGLFEPVQLIGTPYTTTRTPRPEGEIAYDLAASGFKMHLFGNGAYQKVYIGGKNDSASASGVGYGGRFELGGLHLGLAGHMGSGVGLYYAFDGSPTTASAAPGPNMSPTKNELRTFRGYSALIQYALGTVDLDLGFGQTQVLRTTDDKASTDSIIKQQTAISAAVVYHATENVHLDLDFMNTSFEWYGGEKQKLNFINTGATVTF
jgi:hypothetical protein